MQASEDSTTHRPIIYYTLDNTGQATEVDQYDGDTISLASLGATSGLPNAPSSSLLRVRSNTSYDDQSRPYLQQQYDINQSTGALVTSTPLSTNMFHDHRGNVVETSNPGGLVDKMQFDGAHRVIKDSQSDGAVLNSPSTAGTWNEANDATDSSDVVLGQVLTTYDSDGNPILTKQLDRFDNAAVTGSSATGDLIGPTGSGPNSRNSYVANYYDTADRLTSSVNVGTNGGSAYTRPSTPATRSDTALVTSYGYAADTVQSVTITGAPTGGTFTLSYGGFTTASIAYNATAATAQSSLAALTSIGSGNVAVTGGTGGPYAVRFIGTLAGASRTTMTAASSFTGGTSPSVSVVTSIPGGDSGRQQSQTDPKALVSKTDYDLLNRTVGTIAGFTDGVPSTGDDQTTLFTYDGDGNLLTQSAVMPVGTNSQTTGYLYGTSSTSGVFSNDLLAKVEYPDKSTGAASTAAADDKSLMYNALGQPTGMTDQNGNVHGYNYDLLGRTTADIVTTLGTGVDGSVRRLGYSFDTAGRPYQQTSFSDTAGTTIVNQVQDAYNGLGQLITEYQAHSGAVNTSTTPKVQYGFNEMSGGANNSRQTSMTYPNGRVLNYNYNTGIDTTISRVSNEADAAGSGAGTVEAYSYLGVGTVVQRSQGNGINLSLIQQAGDSSYVNDGGDRYTGLDRFGRIIDQYWTPASAPTSPTDRFQYAYDRNSNVLYKSNLLSSSNSELYHANAASSGDNATAYDPLGRLGNFQRGTLSISASHYNGASGLGSLDTVASASRSQGWTLDALGNWSSSSTNGTGTSRTNNSRNQTTAVGAASLAFDNNGNTTTDDTGHTYIYDSWNRLMTVKNGATTLASYKYDAGGRRTFSTSIGQDWYYDSNWQLIEEHCGGTVNVGQYVWSLDGYVDDLVLRDDTASGSNNYGTTTSGLHRRLYAQQDANHNVTALVDTAGTVQQRFLYDPYGAASTFTSAWASTSDAYNWLYKFQGGRVESGTGLINFRHRDFSTSLGRWMEMDPAGYFAGFNQYASFANNAMSNVDPFGTYPINITFMAFIPSNKGFVVKGSPIPGVNWVEEPGIVSGNEGLYNTDDRMTVDKSPHGTFKLKADFSIDSTQIGNLQDAPTLKLASSPTKKIDANHIAPILTGYAYEFTYVPNTLVFKAPEPHGYVYGIENACDSTTVEFRASANNPFIGQSPDIMLDAAVTFEKKGKVRIDVSASGTHNKFPAFGAIVNGAKLWDWYPPDNGPHFGNLSTLTTFQTDTGILE